VAVALYRATCSGVNKEGIQAAQTSANCWTESGQYSRIDKNKRWSKKLKSSDHTRSKQAEQW